MVWSVCRVFPVYGWEWRGGATRTARARQASAWCSGADSRDAAAQAVRTRQMLTYPDVS